MDRPFAYLGNLPCLDLVNTQAVDQGRPVDLLRGFPDLVSWAAGASLLTDAGARTTIRRWKDTGEGAAAFREAVALRTALRALAERLANGRGPTPAAIATINRVLATRPAVQQVIPDGRGFETRTEAVDERAVHLLVPVAASAAWLLEHGDRSLIRRCGNPDCVLYFYDTTRNKRRRWCSMDGCGSRAKAAAYYRRVRSEK